MDGITNDRSSSTTFEWRKVKMSQRRQATQDSRPKGVRWRRFPRREPRDRITVQLWLRGGSEAWVAVRGRGEENYYPGHTQLIDVLLDINQAH